MCEIKILDGSFSAQIKQHVSYDFDKDPLWTASFLKTDPDSVKRAHLDFLRAGSDIIETNTYQAFIDGFKEKFSITDQEAFNLIKKAAELAQDAVKVYKNENPKADPTIFGSIGPYGTCLHDGSEYNGSYTDNTSVETLLAWHKPKFDALIEAGVTHFAIETIPSEKEAVALAEFIKNYPHIKAWISFSCKNDELISHGEKFKLAAIKTYNTNPNQILAVGVNCLNTLYVSKLLQNINTGSNKIPLVVYPNNGDVYEDGEWRVGQAPQIIDCMEEWFDMGVKYIGGCCRTFAKDIKVIRERLIKLGKINDTLSLNE